MTISRLLFAKLTFTLCWLLLASVPWGAYAESRSSELSGFVPRLLDDNTAFSAGASVADARLILVEFSDPTCPYCRAVKVHVDELLSDRRDVRLVFRENPLISAMSSLAAIALVAGEKLGKGAAMRSALLNVPRRPSMSAVLDLAAELGVDRAELERMMADEAVLAEASRRFPQHTFSSDAARAIYAAAPERQRVLRDAVYAAKLPLNRAALERVVRDAGLEYGALSEAMFSAGIDRMLEYNYQLAHDLGVTGTPYFVLIARNTATVMRGWDQGLIDTLLADSPD